MLAAPGRDRLRGGLDAPLAALVWRCMRLAACSPQPELQCLVARYRRLLELRSSGAQRLDPIDGPPGTGEGSQEPEEECAVLRAATEHLSQGVRTGLLRQILDTFTHTQSPLLSLVRAALATPSDEQVKGEISFLCGEVHVLTDALLDVAQILASSPKPSPSLSTRLELLCLELTLQARALTGHLSSSNTDYEHAF
ncbi:hypothetical protein MG293_003632 [Ovis ammon polii]|uniref:Uncharacterized protein n=1 Tax=Ovis ammon polii TaxID=230172 RepID=A0AAD4YH67_OVIAM|nr:hypothetical protein MG293_003632 [Ovis ammon polii]